MKISVVTISYNQAEFLDACINSVAIQEGPWEHIIVDPGSTDGSREIIERHREQFSHIILEPDRGPSDGLNKGFSRAVGDIYYYLNSDDVVLPDTFKHVRAALGAGPFVDVISAHGLIIDETGRPQRKVYSDRVTRHSLAHGAGIRIQPATFIRRAAFERTNGFNIENRSNWDGELIVDLFLGGARFSICNQVWAGYRLHESSITATGKLDERVKFWARRRYEKVMGKPLPARSIPFRYFYSLRRALRHPDIIVARLFGSRVYNARRKG